MARVTSPSAPDAAPRLSATVLLLRDDPLEVLMVSRSARGAFASALVFPGGAIEAEDGDPAWSELVDDHGDFEPEERALRIGAIREVWEETGILLAPVDEAPAARADVATRERMSFREAVAASGARLVLGALTHFGHWVTPVGAPRRFDTHFFLARAPGGQDAVPDRVEILAAEWMPPAAGVELAHSGVRPIIFPTAMNLARLAESTDSAEAIAAARARPRFTVEPVLSRDHDGAPLVMIPAEAGYAVTAWREPGVGGHR